MFAAVCGKIDPTGNDRLLQRDKGKPLAGKSTVNRIEYASVSQGEPNRYKKILYNEQAIDYFIIDKFIQSKGSEIPETLILDIDATDDPVHGHQQGRFFHGYYDCWCYLPLYIFCGDDLLRAKLKTANLDPGNNALDDIREVVTRLRAKWPEVKIIIRGDGGFCRDHIMTWIEEQENVFYLFGLARNSRLVKKIGKELWLAQKLNKETWQPQRLFKNFIYKTRNSWTRKRRVVGKAEWTNKGSNPRFIVCNLDKETYPMKELYEDVYCERGNMENRIKEQQLFLFADRTSCHMLMANQLRLYFASVAYILMNELRKAGLERTELEQAQCSTIRLKLFKIGAVVTISVRRVLVNFSSSYAYQDIFSRVLYNIKIRYPLLN